MPKRTEFSVLIGSLFCITAAFGQTSGSLSERLTRADARRAVAARSSSAPVRSLLAKHVDQVDWLETTFEEVINWLRGAGEDQVNLIPRWRALNAEGIDADTLITLKIKGTTVAEILDEVMRQLSDDGSVTYRGERNILRISTKDDFSKKLEIKVYDVTDILFTIPDMGRSAPTIDLDAVSRQGGQSGGGGGGSGQSVFSGSSSGQTEELEQEEADLEERLEELKNVIMKVVAPETWGGQGGAGGLGSIEVFNGRSLIVRNTVEVHELLGGFFEQSR